MGVKINVRYKWIEEHLDRSVLAISFEEYTKETHKALKSLGYRKSTAVAIDEDGSWVVMYEKKICKNNGTDERLENCN